MVGHGATADIVKVRRSLDTVVPSQRRERARAHTHTHSRHTHQSHTALPWLVLLVFLLARFASPHPQPLPQAIDLRTNEVVAVKKFKNRCKTKEVRRCEPGARHQRRPARPPCAPSPPEPT